MEAHRLMSPKHDTVTSLVASTPQYGLVTHDITQVVTLITNGKGKDLRSIWSPRGGRKTIHIQNYCSEDDYSTQRPG